MAYRVKFRKSFPDGAIKQRILIQQMGVHMLNRGPVEVYPNGSAVRDLGIPIAMDAFDQAEADHNGIVVEEVPTEALADFTEKHSTIRAYNQLRTAPDPLLQLCFPQSMSSTILFGTLSHSHLLLVLLSFLYSGEWKHKDAHGKYTYPCDSQGCLATLAVCERDPVLRKLLDHGMSMEVLSYKIYLEEPEACILISNAMNKAQKVALQTTELAAMASLTGEVTLALETAVSGRVCYETIKEKARPALDTFVDEPEFRELFDTILRLGAGKITYISDFIDWTSRYVNSKFRRLRLCTCAVVNRTSAGPLTQVALMKRSLRKKPVNTFCPPPESAWITFSKTQLQDIEDLLHYFHSSKSSVAQLEKTEASQLLANVDISATEAFVSTAGSAAAVEKRRNAMLAAVAPFYIQFEEELGKCVKAGKMEIPAKTSWMQFAAAVEALAEEERLKETAENGAASAPQPQPVVFEHDEATGEVVRSAEVVIQDSAAKLVETPVKLPWREWYSKQDTPTIGIILQAERAAQFVLHTMHMKSKPQDNPVDVFYLPNSSRETKVVRLTQPVVTGEVLLLPCMPKSLRLTKESLSPFRIPIEVQVRNMPSGQLQSFLFDLLPEWQGPKNTTPSDAVDETSQQVWTWEGKETMNPFWAVRRISRQELQKNDVTKEFNCELTLKAYSVICVGADNAQSFSQTWVVQVPMLTNVVDAPEGTELVWEAAPTPKRKAGKEVHWKDVKAKVPALKKQKKDAITI